LHDLDPRRAVPVRIRFRCHRPVGVVVVEEAGSLATISAASVPITFTVPASTPSGRSVTWRSTSTGLPRLGASSCSPPESVSTM
jgi:hypothetical protein